MDRGLRAQLSPNEDTALRKVAAGSDGDGIPLALLKQLSALGLIQSRDGRWELTDFGRIRMAPVHLCREFRSSPDQVPTAAPTAATYHEHMPR